MTMIERRRILNLTEAFAPRDFLHERRLVVNFADDSALILEELPPVGGGDDEDWTRTRVARMSQCDDAWTLFSFGKNGEITNYSEERAIGPTFADALEALSRDEIDVFWR